MVLVGGAVGVLRRWIAPFVKTQERLQDLETSHRKTEEGIGVLCKCMLALMDNSITGNSIEQIKNARDEMRNYLISRK
jgi:hypothetical protein